MPYEEAAGLIARFHSPGGVVRHIVREMIANSEAEDDWRSVAAACYEMLTSTIQ